MQTEIIEAMQYARPVIFRMWRGRFFEFGGRVKIKNVFLILLALTGCSGGGNQSSDPPPSNQQAFSVGGNVSGLIVGASATLQNNSDQLQVASDGSFTFNKKVPIGTSYSVLVASQPSTQTCAVTSAASGVVTQDISNVAVSCASFAPNTWTFISGSTLANQTAAGTPDPREGAMTWTDSSDNLFLFGGDGPTSNGADAPLGDFWEFSSGRWISVAGSGPSARLAGASWNDGTSFWLFGGYGPPVPDVLGDLWKFTSNQWSVVSESGLPSARTASGFARASDGTVFVFGGQGIATNGLEGMLADLWKYDATAGQWALINGKTALSQQANYGTQGVASISNSPGPRIYPVAWTDANGNFWMFGGEGYDSVGALSFLADLWEYDPVANEWTWVGGSNRGGTIGVYGAQGTASASNWPGGRTQAMHQIDSNGNVFIFGGIGADSIGANGNLNDLWKYSGGTWTWLAGSNVVNQKGMYSSQAVPGARFNGSFWVDSQNHLWLLGGNSIDSTGKVGWQNDLWEYTQ